MLHVVQGHDHPWLQSTWLDAADASWVAGRPPWADGGAGPTPLAAKSRYRQADAACTAAPTGDGFRLDFASPQWAVTPGQSAVLYAGDVCLGGGVIARAAAPPVVARQPRPPRRRSARGARRLRAVLHPAA